MGTTVLQGQASGRVPEHHLGENLLTPTLLKEKTFDEIMKVLKQHYKPKPLVTAEQFNFHSHNQAIGEQVENFMAELRRLSTHCQFREFLDDALRNCFVCRLRSEAAQKQLLTGANLTFQRAVEIAQSMEKAANHTCKLQSPSHAVGHQLRERKDVCKLLPIAVVATGVGSLYRRGKSAAAVATGVRSPIVQKISVPLQQVH